MTPRRLAAGLSVGLLLAGCKTLQPPTVAPVEAEAAYQQRVREIGTWSRWSLVARLSVDDREDGGSGRLQWQVDGQRAQLDFRGTLGRGAWRLILEPGLATLEMADGRRSTAADAATLIWREIGWRVPVQALHYWVRGVHAPGAPYTLSLDERGHVTELSQLGWDIEFSGFDQQGGLPMPGRIEAMREPYRIKLAIGRWTVPVGDGADG